MNLGFIKDLLLDEDGQGMVEYGLILALVSIAAVTILGTLGTTLTTKFTEVNSKLGGSATP